MAMMVAIAISLIVLEVVWQIFIGYPPAVDQLELGIASPITLWAARFIGLGFILAATYFFSKHLETKTKRYFWILVLSVPAISLLWMSYPQDVIKLFIISLVFYFSVTHSKNIIVPVVSGIVVIAVINILIFKEKPKVLEILSFSTLQTEVSHRFITEDNIKPRIEIPIWTKRVAYNKYFIALRDLGNESVGFFDFETLFFQDVHPLDQKAFVIFFWPEIFILAYGLWLIASKKIKVDRETASLLILSFLYYLTSNTSAERRLILLVWPLAIIFSRTLNYLAGQKQKTAKIFLVLALFLGFYGWATNYFDRFIRQDYWLDNRPMVYKFFFSFLKGYKDPYDFVRVPDTLYAAKDYCKFYLDDCSKITVKNFDLPKESADGKTIYIGFIGNFIGPNPQSDFPKDPPTHLDKMNITILAKTQVFNNIANTYGQLIIIARGLQ